MGPKSESLLNPAAPRRADTASVNRSYKMTYDCDSRPLLGGDKIPPGTFHGEDKIPPGTFHGEDKIPPGTFHAS